MQWFTLSPTAGVLELACRLELHITVLRGRTVAWWFNDAGEWMGRAFVGDA